MRTLRDSSQVRGLLAGVACVALALGLCAPSAVAASAISYRPVTFVVTTSSGTPVVGIYVRWESSDGSSEGPGCVLTDGAGTATFLAVPVGEVDLSLEGSCGYEDLGEEAVATESGKAALSWMRIESLSVPTDGDVPVSVGTPPDVVALEIGTVLPDGSPVGGVRFALFGDEDSGPFRQRGEMSVWMSCAYDSHTCARYPYGLVTNSRGRGSTWLFKEWDRSIPCSVGYRVVGAITVKAAFPCLDPGPVIVPLPALPTARITHAPQSVLPGKPATVTVQVRSETGGPLAGKLVLLGPAGTLCDWNECLWGSSEHPDTCDRSWEFPYSQVTDATGRARFAVCPEPAMEWAAGGEGMVSVGSATIGILPGAPRRAAAVPVSGGAKVTWGPTKAYGSPILDYTVTASPGGATCVTTTTTCTVSGLTKGKAYRFTVTARNAYGPGLPSKAVKVRIP